jgi:superfamily II DNA/RNA helicase
MFLLSYLCGMENTSSTKNALQYLQIAALNPMQEAAHKAIIAENDVFLLSPTGSGKTLAFLLPIVELLQKNGSAIQCLIISPTRELSIQIESVWKKMTTGYKINACYGGHDMAIEIQNLKTAPAVLVGTPGRISDHIGRKTVDLSEVQILVLDEFDKSLELGYEEEMTYVIGQLKQLKKRIMVSATAKVQLPRFMGEINPKVLNFNLKEEKTTDQLVQQTVLSSNKDKIDRLFELLCHLGAERCIVFCNHREATERTVALLQEKGLPSAAFFHGGMEQLDREKTLLKFRNGSIHYLVSTDLAARGLDIPFVMNVVHYHFPLKKEEFIHRNGRTARMNAPGTAYLLIHNNEELPRYIAETPEMLDVNSNLPIPAASAWSTLYISGGKKDKLSKIDIVGFFTKKGQLDANDLGLIEVLDFMAFAAVKTNKIPGLLKDISAQKMKGKKYKIEIVR